MATSLRLQHWLEWSSQLNVGGNNIKVKKNVPMFLINSNPHLYAFQGKPLRNIMDVVSHAIWGRHLTHGRLNWKVAAIMAVLPDLLAFIPSTIVQILSGKARVDIDENSVTSDLPSIAWQMYQISHSLVWTFVLFLCIWGTLEYVLKKQQGELLKAGKYLQCEMKPRTAATLIIIPWVYHILIDMPTHTLRFFPTPFLMPFSDFMIDGIMWSTWWVWGLNVIAIIVVWHILNQRTAAMASIAPRA